MLGDLVKWIHILTATLLFGTGLGIAFFKWAGDRSSQIVAIDQINRLVVRADWIFTAPAILLQLISGSLLAHTVGYRLSDPWLAMSLGLFLIAGCCWIRVVYLQHKMYKLSHRAVTSQQQLPPEYHRLQKHWFILGIPAFIAVIAIFYLMVTKPMIPLYATYAR